ncbi:alcohol dehydrogenase catalytic domain-containing protein [Streptomyces sp. NBC_00588]|uniref:alcohol dehydrogenase catalytic domain-containing protein n=1 Tax=Streptomyces sp. NBC_00588 TaxID=2975784 RepID=UPI003FCC6F7A
MRSAPHRRRGRGRGPLGPTAEHRRLGCRTVAPAALGVEGVGRLRAVGPGVQGIAVGDRAVTHEAPLPGGGGFWTERVLVTAAHTAPVPATVKPVAPAALPVNGAPTSTYAPTPHNSPTSPPPSPKDYSTSLPSPCP